MVLSGGGYKGIYTIGALKHLIENKFYNIVEIENIYGEIHKYEGIDLIKDPAALQRLRVEVERAKIELSTVTQTEINLPFITADANGPKHLVSNITRAILEEIASGLIERTVGPCKQAIKDSEIDLKNISGLVCPSPWDSSLAPDINNWAGWAELDHKILSWCWCLDPLEPLQSLKGIFSDLPVLLLTESIINPGFDADLDSINFEPKVEVKIGYPNIQEPLSCSCIVLFKQ